MFDVDKEVDSNFDKTIQDGISTDGNYIYHNSDKSDNVDIVKHEEINLDISKRIDETKEAWVRFDSVMQKEGLIVYKKSFNGNEKGFMYVEVPAALSTDSMMRVVEAVFVFAIIIFIFLIVVFIFIVTQWKSKSKLMRIAYIDGITKGMNWTRFKMVAKKRIRRRNHTYALVLLELDGFTVMNEMFGHKRCEDILRRINIQLLVKKRKKELVARKQDSQFVLLLEYESERILLNRIKQIEEAIQNKMPANFVKYYFGILVIEDMKVSMERRLNYALLAKSKAMEEYEDNIQFFEDKLRSQIMKEKELENNMEEALKNHEYKMYLQPKYSTDGKKVCGAEALVRWISPTMGFISPGEFIPLFEKNQFIKKLDEYMLERVCEFQKKRLSEGKEMITISVNISRVNLSEPKLVDQITEMVDKYEIPHKYVELELTESTFFESKNILIETITKLRENGFSVSMDDFGSGYSSLNSLKDLKLDVVKLDAGFFRGKDEDKKRSTIVVEDTIALAKHLNMKIVAEGIETKEQVDFLDGIGCDLIQGFYFAKPMPVDEFISTVEE